MPNNSLVKKGKVLWFTGMSGAGKSTLANRLNTLLSSKGEKVRILDGDEIRDKIHKELDFSPAGIKMNNMQIIDYCLKSHKDYDYLLVTVIAPFSKIRKKAREILRDSYIEIFVRATLNTVIKRDVKGLYKKALKNEIQNFIGIDPKVPYQVPNNPDIVIGTENNNEDESFDELVSALSRKLNI